MAAWSPAAFRNDCVQCLDIWYSRESNMGIDRRLKPRRRSAFTFVELLVVTGIIAVLIALLLPSLQLARAQARKLQCLSNMRQLGMALMLYANETRGYFPYQEEGSTADNSAGVVNFATTGVPNWLQSLLPYVENNATVLICPDAAATYAFPISFNPTATSATNYLGNGVVMGGIQQTDGIWKTKCLSQIPNSADIICMQENCYAVDIAWLRPYFNGIVSGSPTYIYTHSVYAGWPSGETYCSLHDGFQSGNVIFCDGHGETVRFKQVVAGNLA
jgi:type II secretory pathway pseudopilin PulG